jgi:uncharacterized protein DUF3551
MVNRHRWMRALKIAVVLGVVVGAQLLDSGSVAFAQRRAPPWCAYLGGRDGGFDCSYYTFEQCMATARGLGGRCQPNPAAVQDQYWQPRRYRR